MGRMGTIGTIGTKRLANFMRNVVYICSGIVLMYLFLVSILSTCTLGYSLN